MSHGSLTVDFSDKAWLNPQVPNENPSVCNYCFSNHESRGMVICSRGRDDYVMRSPAPSLEDVWTERIFAALNKNRESSLVNSGDRPDASHSTDLVPLTSEQEEVVRRAEEERLAHRRMIEVLFAEDRRDVIKEEDIPFHGWSCTDIVMLLLEDVINEDSGVIKRKIREEIRRWHPDKFKQKHGQIIYKVELLAVMERVKHVSQALNQYGRDS